MKIFKYVLCIMTLCSQFAWADIVNEDENKNIVVERFLSALKTKDIVEIAKVIEYPFLRKFPIYDIKNEEEFIKNPEMIIDDFMIEFLSETEPQDWETVGWRGIMLPPGFFWLNYDGKLIAVNSYTEKMVEYVKEWEEKDKANLYSELQDYKDVMYVFGVDGAIGRIDIVGDDENSDYRFSFWNEGKTMADKPDILIKSGDVEFYGSANNHTYSFNKGEYEYQFIVTYIGPVEAYPYTFTILKNDEIISEDEAKIIK